MKKQDCGERTGKIRRYLTAAALCAVLLMILPGTGLAAKKQPVIRISGNGENGIEAIETIPDGKQATLFFPGNLDPAEYRIGFDSEQLWINGEEAVSTQTPASVLRMDIPNEIEFRNGGKSTKVRLTVMQGSQIPSMYITTESGTLNKVHKDKTQKEKGSMALYDSDGTCVFSGDLKHIKIRGNSSAKFTKKSYTIKLEEGASLLHMGKAKRWILTGNQLDKSLMRNQIVFDMARYAGMPYTPECRQIALYINHEYRGLYLLSEKVEIDDDRVDIRDLEKETEKMNENSPSDYPTVGKTFAKSGNYKGYAVPHEPEDISGGYLIEYDSDLHNYVREPSVFVTDRCMTVIVHSPEYCSEAQIRYISDLMKGFENAIFSRNGKDPATGKHYSDFVDFDSLVNKYLINEVSKNYDSNMSSEYYYKPDDSVSTKAFAGPVWDMDNTFGNYARPGYRYVISPNGMLASSRGSLHYWWPELYRQPDFHEAVVKRYHETFVPALEILLGLREETETLKAIDSYAAAIEKSVAMEYVLFPNLKNKSNQVNTGHNLAENVQYLKNYITKRMQYLSGEWKQP